MDLRLKRPAPAASTGHAESAGATGQVDWQRPWLAPFAAAAAQAGPMSQDWPTRLDVAAKQGALTNSRGLPLRFVPQASLPENEAYEAFIDRTGGVPTRPNLHDYFNALAWLTYPAAKRALNALQAAELARAARLAAAAATVSRKVVGDPTGEGSMPPDGRRGKLRDRATIFDENAALLLSADPALDAALRRHDWATCFERWRQPRAAVELRLFGHALLEKLVAPYKAITAHVWILPVEPDFFLSDEAVRCRRLDGLLEARVAQGMLGEAPTPLPVLGVPGWWPQQDAAFYDDMTVFRKAPAGIRGR